MTSSALAQRVGAHLRRPEIVVGTLASGAVLVLLWLTVWRGPFIGLADNGDWIRYLCSAELAADPPGLYFTEVPTRLVASYDCGWNYRSSHVAVLLGVRAINKLTGGGPVALESLSLWYGIAAAVGFGALGYQLTRATKRPIVVAGAVVAMAVAFSDITFSSYLGSAYAEAFVFTATPLLLALVVAVVRERARWWMWGALAIGSIAVTMSKPPLAFVAATVVTVIVLARRSDWPRLRVASGMAAVGALGLVVFNFTAFSWAPVKEANHTNFVFTTLMVEVDDPEALLVDFGVSPRGAAELARYTGAGYFDPEEGPSFSSAFDEFLEEVSRLETALFVVTHPGVGWDIARQAVGAIPEARVDGLANYADPDGDLLAERPEPVRAVVEPLVGVWWLLLPLVWLGMLILGIRLLWRDSGHAGAAIAVVLAAAALTTTVLSVGDGYADLDRHAAIGAWFNGALIFGALGALGGMGIERAVHGWRPSASSRLRAL